MNKDDGSLEGAEIKSGNIQHSVFERKKERRNHEGRKRFKIFMMEERRAEASCHEVKSLQTQGKYFSEKFTQGICFVILQLRPFFFFMINGLLLFCVKLLL